MSSDDTKPDTDKLDAEGLKGALGRTGRMLKTAGLPFEEDEFDEETQASGASKFEQAEGVDAGALATGVDAGEAPDADATTSANADEDSSSASSEDSDSSSSSSAD